MMGDTPKRNRSSARLASKANIGTPLPTKKRLPSRQNPHDVGDSSDDDSSDVYLQPPNTKQKKYVFP